MRAARLLLALLALVALAVAAPKAGDEAVAYTLTGSFTEGCVNLCKCATRFYDVTGTFDLQQLPAGLLLQNVNVLLTGTARVLTGVAALHINATNEQVVRPHPLCFLLKRHILLLCNDLPPFARIVR